MPQQLQTRGPVQVREYAADPSAQGGADRTLIERVRVHEKGPDVIVEAYAGHYRLGHLAIPREHEREMVCRMFGEVPELRTDRAAFQVILQEFEDAVLARNAEALVLAWRRAMAAYDTMARDVATLAALPQTERGAA
jgi:hypothetical protein